MTRLTLPDTWLIQENAFSNSTFPKGVFLFVEYGNKSSDPTTSKAVNLIEVNLTDYNLTQSVLLADGTYELVFQGSAIPISGLVSDLKSFPIYSDMTELGSGDYDAVCSAIGGTP